MPPAGSLPFIPTSRTAVKLPSIPSRGDLAAQARNLAGKATSGAARAADSASRTAADAGRAAASTAAQASQRLGVNRLPGMSGLTRTDGADAGPRITGTPFARTIATAFASRPHRRSPASVLMGTDVLRTGFHTGLRERKQLKNAGFAPEAVNASGLPELDVTELIHIHGRRLPNIMLNASSRLIKRDTRAVIELGKATGSLHWITVSEQEQAQGAMGWTRLCVDTDQTERVVTIFDDRHLDVVIAPVGQEPGEYATDMAGILPQGIPPDRRSHPSDDAPAPAGPGPYRGRRRRRRLHAVQECPARGTRLTPRHGGPGQAGRAVAGEPRQHQHHGHPPRLARAIIIDIGR